MTLGDIIFSYRTEHKMSMDGFAELSGISKGYISMLEKNKTQRGEEPSPSIDIYRNVAKAMGLDVDELIRMVDGKISLFPSTPAAANLLPLPRFVKSPAWAPSPAASPSWPWRRWTSSTTCPRVWTATLLSNARVTA